MTNIKDLYISTLSNPNQWSYYCLGSWFTSNFKWNDFLLQDFDYMFISELLRRGGKGDVCSSQLIKDLNRDRKQHIISCFILGNIIYNCCLSIQKLIDKSIEKIRPSISNNYQENAEKRFRYIWMLISLFHDLGYSIEEGSCQKEKDIEKAFNNLRVFKNLKRPYTKKLVKQYYKYRMERWKFIDHGIAGGALLYRDLCKLRKEKETFDTELFWGKELEKDFSYASWAIACHNIYKIEPSDDSEIYYRQFKLDDIVTTKKIIPKEKLPLLFLLCLVDSIEPIKQMKDSSLLESIYFDFLDDKLIIDLEQLSVLKRCDYLGKILSLKTWLTDVEIENNIRAKIIL